MVNIKLVNKSLKSELEKITVKKYNSNKIECDVTNDKEYSNEHKTVNVHKINRLQIQLNRVQNENSINNLIGKYINAHINQRLTKCENELKEK